MKLLRWIALPILILGFTSAYLSASQNLSTPSRNPHEVTNQKEGLLGGSVGRYSITCKDCSLSGTELVCSCKSYKPTPSWKTSYIDLDDKIKVQNGNIVFKHGSRIAQYCRLPCQLDLDTTVTCSCGVLNSLTGNIENYRPTSIELGLYIKNDNGQLKWSQ